MIEVDVQINQAYGFLRTYGRRWEIIMGGAGAGKSYAIQQSILIGALECPTRKYLCVRKVAKSLRHSVFAVFLHLISDMGLAEYFTVNRTDMTIRCVSGAEIICCGLDDVAKLKSIFGITDVFVEEATECTPEDITQLNLRARGKGPQKRLILAFNPISASHFLKRRFFDVPADNVSLHVMTYKDNAFLDPDDVEVLEEMRERDPDSYQVYALAQWGTHSSVLVFTNFEIRDFAYGADDLEDVGQGVDFGFNHASCVERSGMKDGELYVFDEFYQKGITNPELIEDVKAFDPGYERNRYVGDSAEPARIEEFLKAGFRKMTACRKGAGSVKAGIDHLKSMRIYVHRTRCPQLARTIAEFKYRLDRQGNLTDEFQSIDDDPIDALRYSRDGDALRVRGLSGKRRAEMAARRRVA